MHVEGYKKANCVYDWVQLADGKNLNTFGDVCDQRNQFNVPSIGNFSLHHDGNKFNN